MVVARVGLYNVEDGDGIVKKVVRGEWFFGGAEDGSFEGVGNSTWAKKNMAGELVIVYGDESIE